MPKHYNDNLLEAMQPICDHTHMFTFKQASMCACTWLRLIMKESNHA